MVKSNATFSFEIRKRKLADHLMASVWDCFLHLFGVCVCVCTCMCHGTHRGQRATCSRWFSLSTMSILGFHLRSSDSVASVFTH